MDPHRLAEARSLAAHRLIAERLGRDPAIVARARDRVASWLESGTVARPYAERWAALLACDAEAIAVAITDPSEEGCALRQCTPFAGVLAPRERWRLWSAVRRELEAR